MAGYHYTESGLQNIWLANGFTKQKTKYGEGVAIHDVDGLHRVIGKAIARKPKMTGAEMRFLRKELGLSQGALAALLGTTEQTVSLWERRGNIARAADRLVRLLYLEHIGSNPKVTELIERLAQQDVQETIERLTFKEHAGRWKEAA
jgi:DNA-binding transcriptional regulator YiaG